MGTGILSHPFRLAGDGSVATVEDLSPDAVSEAIAVLLLTRRGEHEMAPGFGTTDPTFAGVDRDELGAQLDAYGPDGVTITDLTSKPVNDTTITSLVAWQLTDPADDAAAGDVDTEEVS